MEAKGTITHIENGVEIKIPRFDCDEITICVTKKPDFGNWYNMTEVTITTSGGDVLTNGADK